MVCSVYPPSSFWNPNSTLSLPGPLLIQTLDLKPLHFMCPMAAVPFDSAPSRRHSHLDATQILRCHHHPNPFAAAQSIAFGFVLWSDAKVNANNW